MLWNFIWMMSSVNICDRWCSCALSDLVLLWRTDGKQFNPSIPQSLCGRHHIVLWLPVRDEDSDFGNARPGSRLWFEAVLKDEGQSQTWKDTHTHTTEWKHTHYTQENLCSTTPWQQPCTVSFIKIAHPNRWREMNSWAAGRPRYFSTGRFFVY